MTHAPGAVRRIAVLGGGITGLAAAYTLARAPRAGTPIEVFLIEASDRLGGLIRTEQVDGFTVEAGPDSFVAEKPEAPSLCRELGLSDSLLASNDHLRRTYILHRGRLVPLPEGMRLFVPTGVWSVLKTPLLSLRAKLALAANRLDLARAAGARGAEATSADESSAGEESAAAFVRRHFGQEVLDNIADPLLAGIYGGDSAVLSARSTLPALYEMERRYGSLAHGAREAARQAGGVATAPLFLALRGGLEQMVDALRKSLTSSRLYLGQCVRAIERLPEGGSTTSEQGSRAYRIVCEGGAVHQADAIILALPAHQCSRVLSALDPELARLLETIPYTSALTVALGYHADTLDRDPGGFGFLVPRKEKRRMLACTFVHNKFAHRAPAGKILLRCFLGGIHDPEILSLDDSEIVGIVRRELQAFLNLRRDPLFYRIYRWPASMPQYTIGHGARVKAKEVRLRDHPGVFVAGNAYSGIGISDSIREGRAVAEQALESCARQR